MSSGRGTPLARRVTATDFMDLAAQLGV